MFYGEGSFLEVNRLMQRSGFAPLIFIHFFFNNMSVTTFCGFSINFMLL